MTNIIVEAEVSVDGVTGEADPEFWGQIFRHHSDDVTDYLNQLIETPEALLMGRLTSRGFRDLAVSSGANGRHHQRHAKVRCFEKLAGTADLERGADQGRYRSKRSG